MLWAKQRTWGWYLTLLRTPWLCVKLLRFAPGGKLSVQRHMHRNEWWGILKGIGIVEFSHKDPSFEEGIMFPVIPWCAFIFVRTNWHSFEASKRPVYALEIQWGRKVSETDIERWPA